MSERLYRVRQLVGRTRARLVDGFKAGGKGIRRAARWTARIQVLLPHVFHALIYNARVRRNYREQVAGAWVRAGSAPNIDVGQAVALWQFETDRLNGLATKGAAVLAADALIGAGVATQTSSDGLAKYACMACIIYLVSAAVAACLAQMPTERHAVQPANVLDGTAATEMVAVVIANEPLGIQLQNLVYVSVRDTFASLVLLLLTLLSNLLC